MGWGRIRPHTLYLFQLTTLLCLYIIETVETHEGPSPASVEMRKGGFLF